MENRYTKQAKEVLAAAKRYAKELKHPYIGTEHLLLGLKSVFSGVASQVLEMNGLKEEEVLKVVSELVSVIGEAKGEEAAKESPRLLYILEESRNEAEKLHAPEIGTEHLLLAIIRDTECVAARILTTLNLNLQKILQDILIAIGENQKKYMEKSEGNNGNILEQYCQDLTELARNGKMDPVVGREQEMQRLMQILSRRTKQSLPGGRTGCWEDSHHRRSCSEDCQKSRSGEDEG